MKNPLKGIGDAFKKVGDGIKKGVEKAAAPFKKIIDIIDAILKFFKRLFSHFGLFCMVVLNSIVAVFLYLLVIISIVPGWLILNIGIPLLLILLAVFFIVFALIMFVPLLAVDYVLRATMKQNILVFFRCDNTPDMWLTRANFNVFKRTGLCFYPCASGFRSTMGPFLCLKTPKDEPGFCAHAEIVRVHMNLWNNRNVAPLEKVSMPSIVNGKDITNKHSHAIKNRMHFLKKCNDVMKVHDKSVRTVCLGTPSFASANSRLSSTLCTQLFCDGKPGNLYCNRNAIIAKGIINDEVDIPKIVMNASIVLLCLATLIIVYIYSTTRLATMKESIKTATSNMSMNAKSMLQSFIK